MAFSGESVHRCLCFGEGDGPHGRWYACPPDLCEAERLLSRAEAAEAEVALLREALEKIAEIDTGDSGFFARAALAPKEGT